MMEAGGEGALRDGAPVSSSNNRPGWCHMDAKCDDKGPTWIGNVLMMCVCVCV